MNRFKICNSFADFIIFIFKYKQSKEARVYEMENLKNKIELYNKEIADSKAELEAQILVKDDIERCVTEIIDYFSRCEYKIHR